MSEKTSFPFRWVLPVAQIVVCLVALYPVREFLFAGLMAGRYARAIAAEKSGGLPDAKRGYSMPAFTAEELRSADVEVASWERRKLVPVVLNVPVLTTQLPYILLNPTKSEWKFGQMPPDVWRALSWPVVGIFFWWLAGRGLEALAAARRLVVKPRMGRAETAFAVILSLCGIVVLIGLVTSTPDDRADRQFMALMAGGILWGVLASVTVAARVWQWRIGKRNRLLEDGADVMPPVTVKN